MISKGNAVPLGDFVAVLAIREDQRNKADERVAMSFKKARGEIPFGYRLAADGVHVEADAKEQAILTRMRALFQQKGSASCWACSGVGGARVPYTQPKST
jgi:UV DNA damage repair endonuclease